RATGDAPLVCLSIESREQPRVRRERHLLRLARFQHHTLEAEQAHTLFVRCGGKIDLWHVRTFLVARVGHGEGRGDRLLAGQETGVRFGRRSGRARADQCYRRLPDLRRRGFNGAVGYAEVAIGEIRVAEAVPECVERFGILLRVPAITDLRTLVITNGDRRAPWGAET